MKLKVNAPCDYSSRMQAGQIVEIDKLKRTETSSGFSARVVGIWKKPELFDLGWFIPEKKKKEEP